MSRLTKGWRYIAVPRSPQWVVVRRFATINVETDNNHATNFEDFGDYSIILPDEPIVLGTSHIEPRFVPGHIHRPPYVGKGMSYQESTPKDPGKIKLGTNEEVRIREAAALARKVREFAKSLVRVRCMLFVV